MVKIQMLTTSKLMISGQQRLSFIPGENAKSYGHLEELWQQLANLNLI
jgi:hypothetical protein